MDDDTSMSQPYMRLFFFLFFFFNNGNIEGTRSVFLTSAASANLASIFVDASEYKLGYSILGLDGGGGGGGVVYTRPSRKALLHRELCRPISGFVWQLASSDLQKIWPAVGRAVNL